MKDCVICMRGWEDTPLVFRSDPWCSDHCRKVFNGEIEPTPAEWDSLNNEAYDRLVLLWDKRRG